MSPEYGKRKRIRQVIERHPLQQLRCEFNRLGKGLAADPRFVQEETVAVGSHQNDRTRRGAAGADHRTRIDSSYSEAAQHLVAEVVVAHHRQQPYRHTQTRQCVGCVRTIAAHALANRLDPGRRAPPQLVYGVDEHVEDDVASAEDSLKPALCHVVIENFLVYSPRTRVR